MKQKAIDLGFVFFLSFSYQVVHSTELDNCMKSNVESCTECIAIEGCSWCADPLNYNNPNLVVNGCRKSVEQIHLCDKKYIYPQPTRTIVENVPLSDVETFTLENKIQMSPQILDIALPPGQPVDLQVFFKLVEEQPVDVFYLLDAGIEANEEHISWMRTFAQQLGKSLGQSLKNFRLGFGEINSQINLEPVSVEDPIILNMLPLTDQVHSFDEATANINTSSRTLPIELAQAAVCLKRKASFQRLLLALQDSINWQKDAEHFLVFVPSNNFSDVRRVNEDSPNTENCSSAEVKSSLGDKLALDKVIPLFLVPSISNNEFENQIEGAITAELSSDPSNVIESLKTVHNNAQVQVSLEVELPDGIRMINPTSQCQGSLSKRLKGLRCDNVKLGNVLNFTMQLITNTSLASPVTVSVSPRGFTDVLRVNVKPQNECPCIANSSYNCSGHGTYDCGVCLCDEGYSGHDCKCDAQNGQNTLAYLDECTDHLSETVCSDRGECDCGICMCFQYPRQNITGRYCECSDATCDRVRERLCNDAGTCVCGQCICDEGWTGNACACTLDASACYDTSEYAVNSSVPCNGNGDCHCGLCVCDTYKSGSYEAKYRGAFCSNKPEIVTCSFYKDCVQCLAFGTGAYNDTEICQKHCSKVEKVDSVITDGFEESCRYVDARTNCIFEVLFLKQTDVMLFSVETNPDPAQCYASGKGAVVDKPCNGIGVCSCGECSCEPIFGNGMYQDRFCQVTIYCSQHQDCVQCLAFGTGHYNDTKVCQANCDFYKVNHASESPTDGYDQGCRFHDLSNNFTYNSYFKVTNHNIVVIVTAEPDASSGSVSYLKLAVGLAIAAAVLLVIVGAYCFLKKSRHSVASSENEKSSVAYTSGKQAVDI